MGVFVAGSESDADSDIFLVIVFLIVHPSGGAAVDARVGGIGFCGEKVFQAPSLLTDESVVTYRYL